MGLVGWAKGVLGIGGPDDGGAAPAPAKAPRKPGPRRPRKPRDPLGHAAIRRAADREVAEQWRRDDERERLRAEPVRPEGRFRVRVEVEGDGSGIAGALGDLMEQRSRVREEPPRKRKMLEGYRYDGPSRYRG